MRKIGNVVLIGVLFIWGLLCMTSISFAQDDSWIPITNLPTPRGALSTSVVDGKIYAIGGTNFSAGLTFSNVEVYDPVMNTWDTTKAPMPTARWLMCSTNTAVNGKIYAIGGLTTFPGDALATVEVYDTVTDSWDTKAPMPTARTHLATCVVDGKIYAIGGRRGDTVLPTVEMYDPVTDTWTTKAPMPTARWGLCASTVNGNIYAIGGATTSFSSPPWAGTTRVEEYNPVTDTWTQKESMHIGRLDLAGVELNGRIYAIGGGDSSLGTNLATVEAYDPVTDTWTQREDLPTPRGQLSASTVNEQMYVVGGFGQAPTYPVIAEVLVYNPPVIAVWEEFSEPPNVFTLKQNYPNPFNPITTISYDLHEQSHVTIIIFNLLGREIKTLVNQTQEAGFKSVQWDARDDEGNRMSGGVYLYSIKAGNYQKTKKMVLLK
jgi:N-acetylneuraminic acid mutarotase